MHLWSHWTSSIKVGMTNCFFCLLLLFLYCCMWSGTTSLTDRGHNQEQDNKKQKGFFVTKNDVGNRQRRLGPWWNQSMANVICDVFSVRDDDHDVHVLPWITMTREVFQSMTMTCDVVAGGRMTHVGVLELAAACFAAKRNSPLNLGVGETQAQSAGQCIIHYR